jgi:7-carboxy-7-deazaguanine synthase
LPCVFIRLAGCNLRCHWCDTRYSYKPAFQMSIPEIVERVLEYHPVTLVCLTGGEPLLQSGSVALMQQLLDAGCTVTLETNGSLPLDAVPQAVERICDMKCPGSGAGDSFLSINLRQLHAGRDQLSSCWRTVMTTTTRATRCRMCPRGGGALLARAGPADPA